MAIMDFLNRQFIDVIEWVDDSRDTLSFRFPDDDKQIKNEAQLIVRESQVAQFVYVGQFADTLGPGKHTLKTENIPILGDLLGWKYKFQTPFKADVYYVTTRVFAGNKWGTANPVMMRDADFGVVRMRAFGTYDFKIVDPVLFLKEVAGTDHQFRLDEFTDVMRSRIVSVFSEPLAAAKVLADPALQDHVRKEGACFLAGLHDDTYGLPTAAPWGMDFGDGIPRHPTQLYEIAVVLPLGLALMLQTQAPFEAKTGLRGEAVFDDLRLERLPETPVLSTKAPT